MKRITSIGIDAGSTALKIVGLGGEGQIAFSVVEESHPKIEAQTDALLGRLREQYDLSSSKIVATGYGSNLLQADKKVTEITCHAKGIFTYFGTEGTAVDIGGQDNKVMRISKSGKVMDFIMNDKCASGTGRFLENTAWRLKIPIEKMANLALNSDGEVPISSTCAVFAESEVISHLSRGEKLEHVIRGLHRALVKRIVSMIYSVGMFPPLMLSGGVAKNQVVAQMMGEETGEPIRIPEDPQIIGAYGAAILGMDA